MRSIVVLFVISLNIATVCGQGVMTFGNRLANAPVSLADGSGPGESMKAGLFLIQNGTLQLVHAELFRTGAESRPKFTLSTWISVPGVPPGASATFRLRVWPANMETYEQASTRRTS